MTCSGKNCAICAESRKFNKSIRAARSGSRTQIEKHIKEWFNAYINESADNNYYHAILDGSWPSAVEILERALEKAKQMAAERED